MSISNILQKLLLSALLSSVCIATVVSADDTEIFFGQSKDEFNTNPNVMFVIDTSGSMGNVDEGYEGKRMERLKIAMRTLLQQSSSYNVGLAAFQSTFSGGSIRYPVGDLEGDSSGLCPDGVCPDERVVVKPSSSSDDATQNNDTGIVTLDASELSMADVTTTTDTSSSVLTGEVSGSALAVAITAENETYGHDIDTRAITSDNRWFFNDVTNIDEYGINITSDDHYAYRFENIDIPAGATVTSASLTFTQTNAAAQTGNLSALIKLEVDPEPAPLPDGANGEATLAQRLATPGLTTTGIAWDNVPPDTTGTSSTTMDVGGTAVSPDLSDPINLIINLPNWSSGNALSILMDPVDEYQPSELDIREFRGLDAPESMRPVLNYTYSENIDTDISNVDFTAVAHVDEITKQVGGEVSRNSTNPSARTFFASAENFSRRLAFRFNNLDIPSNAVIQTATLELTGADADSDSDENDWIVDPTTSSGIDTPDTVADDTFITDPITTIESTLTLNISAEKTGSPVAYNTGIPKTEDLTSTFYAWDDFTISPNEEKSTTGLQGVIAAVINGDQWNAGDDLSLVLEAPDNYNNVVENSTLIQTAAGTAKPKLYITWKAGETNDTTLLNTQTTAFRYSNVHIPPGAEIKTAKLVFNAAKASVGDVRLEISAEDSSVSPPLSNDFNNIGARTLTGKRVNWDVEPWPIPNVEYSSPEIVDVIKAITTKTDWCGGNPITILLNKLHGDDSRHAVSFDQNQVYAPRLEITYSIDNVTTGAYCSNATIQSSITQNKDDAVQRMDSNVIINQKVSLDTKHPTSNVEQIIGLRFRDIEIPPGTAIIGAELELTHEKDVTESQNYEIRMALNAVTRGFNSADGFRIVPTAEEIALGDYRQTYPDSITKAITPGPRDTSIFNIDVSSLVSEKIADTAWNSGEDMVLIIDALGDKAHSFYAFDAGELYAPKLKIYYQSQRDQAGTRFRDNLIEIVDSLVAKGTTPLVGAYYEASQYFLGEAVDYGLQRGRQFTNDRYHRVSHPGSYIDGVVYRPSGCADADLNADECIDEVILPKNGRTPTYISPMVSECQQNHIVLLSDGVPNFNSAANKIRNLTGDSYCQDTGGAECGQELASWLHTSDVDGVLNGTQNVTTHTIGFNLEDSDLLRDIAAEGGGGFYEAQSASELVNAFRNIFINVSKTDTSFVAPSTTISQANRLKNREDIYFSLFKPEGTARWAGNLKRYKLGVAAEGEEADILDVNDNAAVNEETGRFYGTAKSYWSDVVDGDSVLLGGAAEKIETNGVSFDTREVYTYTGNNTDLTALENDLMPENPELKREWLLLPSSVLSDEEYITDMLYWAHGKDVFDIDGDGDTEEARGQMGDPLHSQPLVVNYVGGKSVVHVATNEGLLHAIDHATGEENFAFMPKELLKNIRANYENEPTRNRPYGLDGGMTLWIDDYNKDGIVDPATDKAYLYVGMRRGGNRYYALNITDPTAPEYMWSINGGTETVVEEGVTNDSTIADGDFSNLGETWSKPMKTKIYDNNEIVDVLIFGAGYGTNQDPTTEATPDPSNPTADTRQTRQTDTVGLGFYIVDALTGEWLYNPNLTEFESKELKYSVPGDLRVIDINFDGLVDQIYFGDMGGQVWRFDYNNDPALNEVISKRMSGDRIGIFANDTPEGARRFYYPPDVALLSIDGKQELSISIGSGWRAHPLDDVVEDRFYNFRMTQVYGAPRRDDGEIRYPQVTETTTGMVELQDTDVARIASSAEKGWYLPLRTGEKVLSSSVTLDGNILFTSYVPSANTGSCAAAIGSGSFYYLDAATGNPVVNLDVDPDSESSGTEDESELDAEDRRRAIPNAGIPPEATLLFPEETAAPVPLLGRNNLTDDGVVIDPGSLVHRTFWHEVAEESL